MMILIIVPTDNPLAHRMRLFNGSLSGAPARDALAGIAAGVPLCMRHVTGMERSDGVPWWAATVESPAEM